MVTQTESVLSPHEALMKILLGESLEDLIVLGSLKLDDSVLNQSHMIALQGVTIQGGLSFRRTVIEGDLDLSGITIEGSLELLGVKFSGNLDLCTKGGPRKIYVTPDLAERVHWAAPTVPLVVGSLPYRGK